jgi:cytidyltransferase-like protein
MKLVVVTGGFDPLHSGHISYLIEAKKLGSYLLVGVNSDEWLQRKKGRAFMPIDERSSIISNLKCVDGVLDFDDSDGSACSLLQYIKDTYKQFDEIIFANGGDRTEENIPEMSVTGITFAFGVGGNNKANSSSWILDEWKAPRTERSWGYYRVLHEDTGIKVKELTVEPGQSISMQYHSHRAEYWMIVSGACIVNTETTGGYRMPPKKLSKHQEFKVLVNEWHQITNPFDVPCKLIEIQYGMYCTEEDIKRK